MEPVPGVALVRRWRPRSNPGYNRRPLRGRDPDQQPPPPDTRCLRPPEALSATAGGRQQHVAPGTSQSGHVQVAHDPGRLPRKIDRIRAAPAPGTWENVRLVEAGTGCVAVPPGGTASMLDNRNEDQAMLASSARPRCHLATVSLVVATGLSLGGCPRPDDLFEPNNTLETATPLTAGEPVTARATQSDSDVFAVEAAAGQTVVFRAESLDFEVCPLFTASGPDGTVLYHEPDTNCREFRPIEPDVQVPGSSLTIIPEEAFELRVPAAADGPYFLTILEGGHVDNIFDYSWEYRLTATFE